MSGAPPGTDQPPVLSILSFIGAVCVRVIMRVSLTRPCSRLAAGFPEARHHRARLPIPPCMNWVSAHAADVRSAARRGPAPGPLQPLLHRPSSYRHARRISAAAPRGALRPGTLQVDGRPRVPSCRCSLRPVTGVCFPSRPWFAPRQRLRRSGAGFGRRGPLAGFGTRWLPRGGGDLARKPRRSGSKGGPPPIGSFEVRQLVRGHRTVDPPVRKLLARMTRTQIPRILRQRAIALPSEAPVPCARPAFARIDDRGRKRAPPLRRILHAGGSARRVTPLGERRHGRQGLQRTTARTLPWRRCGRRRARW